MRFGLRDDGAVSVLFIVLMPLILFAAGLAIDLSALNHQRRYVQGQADVGALSGIRHFVSAAAVRDAARRSVSANTVYGTIRLADARIELGSLAGAQFTPNADQTEIGGANAVRVTVPSPARLSLLSLFIDDRNAAITRSAVATVDPRVSFGLRNCLLNATLLSPTLRPIIGGNVDVLCSGRGIDADLDLATFLGGLSLRAAALTPSGSSGTYGDILDAQYAASDVIAQALGVPTTLSRQPVRLGDVLYLPEDLRRVRVGSPFPAITVRSSDVVLASAAILQKRIADATVTLNLGNYANLAARVTVSDPPQIVLGVRPGDPSAVARTAQIRVDLPTLDVAGIFTMRLRVEIAHAEARLTGQGATCSQSAQAEVAVFDPATAGLVHVDVEVKVLGLPVSLGAVSTAAGSLVQDTTARIAFRYQDYMARSPRTFGPATPQALNTLNAQMRTVTANLLDQASRAIRAAQPAQPGCIGPLGCLVGGVVNTVATTVNAVLATLGPAIPRVTQGTGVEGQLVNGAVGDLLGLGIARADLTLLNIDCANGIRLGL